MFNMNSYIHYKVGNESPCSSKKQLHAVPSNESVRNSDGTFKTWGAAHQMHTQRRLFPHSPEPPKSRNYTISAKVKGVTEKTKVQPASPVSWGAPLVTVQTDCCRSLKQRENGPSTSPKSTLKKKILEISTAPESSSARQMCNST